MIPQQTLENFSVFGDNATKVKPDDAKYAAGFQANDVLPAEWLNWEWNKASSAVTKTNEGLSSIESELNNILTELGESPDKNVNNQIITCLNKIYPQVCECSTSASTETKLISVSGNVMKAGKVYAITMSYGNTYGDGSTTYPKISINNGTAYPMCDSKGAYLKTGAWEAGDVVTVLFTGSRFLMATNVVDKVESGNMAAITSNAVAQNQTSSVASGNTKPVTSAAVYNYVNQRTYHTTLSRDNVSVNTWQSLTGSFFLPKGELLINITSSKSCLLNQTIVYPAWMNLSTENASAAASFACYLNNTTGRSGITLQIYPYVSGNVSVDVTVIVLSE